MDRLSIEKAMIKNMIEKTGKPIEEWIKIIKEKYFVGHGGIVMFLNGPCHHTISLPGFKCSKSI